MKIAVIVKTDLNDPKVYTTHRAKVNFNPDNLFLSSADKSAIEYALKCIKNQSGEVDTYTFENGILADRVLHEALAMGVNTATKFVGVDSYDPLQTTITAKQFADYIKKHGNYHLIITAYGRECDNLAPFIAKNLNMEFIDHVSKIDTDSSFETKLEKGVIKGRLEYPAVVSVLDSINTPHLPSFINLRDAFDAQINKVSLSTSEEHSKIVADQTKQEQIIFDLHQDPDAVQKLVDVLKNDGILK